MSSTDRSHIAIAFKKALQFRREQIYGSPEDRHTPHSIAESATTPYLGYVGTKYRLGGTLLVAANPGGGGDTQSKTPGDAALEKALLALRDAPSDASASAMLDEVGAAYIEQVKVINLRKIVYPVLKAAKVDITEIAFLNAFPYRTRDNDAPSDSLIRLASREIGKPLVEVLAPARIFFLGSGMGKIASEAMQAPTIHILKRARGDSYVLAETQKLLDALE